MHDAPSRIRQNNPTGSVRDCEPRGRTLERLMELSSERHEI